MLIERCPQCTIDLNNPYNAVANCMCCRRQFCDEDCMNNSTSYRWGPTCSECRSTQAVDTHCRICAREGTCCTQCKHAREFYAKTQTM